MSVHAGDLGTVVAQLGPDDLTGATVTLAIRRPDGTVVVRPGVVAPIINGVATNNFTAGCTVGSPSPWLEGLTMLQFQLARGSELWAMDEFVISVGPRLTP